MNNKILLLIVVILGVIYNLIGSSKHTTFFNTIPNIKVKQKNDEIKSMDLEQYIVGVVAAEMPASFDEEALKAQAVAARSYATYKMQKSNNDYDVVTTVANQSYITVEEMQNKWQDSFNKYYTKIVNAVNATKGEIMTYKDEVVEAFYFAMSNGYTEDVNLVFGENKDYLKSVKSIYDMNNKKFVVEKEFSKEEICNKLNINCNNLIFSNIERSNSNRVISLKVNDKIFKGTTFRHKLGLRSTDFDIKINSNKIIITTRGYGHGVGMSQYGANGMAKEGYSYEEILKYFYKNIKISSI